MTIIRVIPKLQKITLRCDMLRGECTVLKLAAAVPVSDQQDWSALLVFVLEISTRWDFCWFPLHPALLYCNQIIEISCSLCWDINQKNQVSPKEHLDATHKCLLMHNVTVYAFFIGLFLTHTGNYPTGKAEMEDKREDPGRWPAIVGWGGDGLPASHIWKLWDKGERLGLSNIWGCTPRWWIASAWTYLLQLKYSL